MKKEKSHLWYTRRGKEIRGPFPVGMIKRYILLGRILDTDELSHDQLEWFTVAELPDVKPDELKLDLSIPEHRERLRIAKLREDERQPDDRRAQFDENEKNESTEFLSRSGVERREKEANTTLRRRKAKSEFLTGLKKDNENYIPRVVVIVGLVAFIIWSSIAVSPDSSVLINDCGQAPKPYVNWSNCSMEGSRLQNLDLSGAKLLNTKMTGSNLSNVNLSGAKLSYIDLSNTTVYDSILQDTMLMGANLRSTKLTNANMTNSDLSFAILQGADLSNVNFQNANLRHAIFNGANLKGVNFSGAILDKAIWTDNTVCSPASIGRCIPEKTD